MCRQLVDAQTAGKALAAVNLAFFLGTALMQIFLTYTSSRS